MIDGSVIQWCTCGNPKVAYGIISGQVEGWLKSTAKKSERWARKRVAVLGHENVDFGVPAATAAPALYIQIEYLSSCSYILPLRGFTLDFEIKGMVQSKEHTSMIAYWYQ